MRSQRTGFARRYRAALLDYLLDGGEAGRDRAYGLGRWAIELDLGLLQLLRVHQTTVNAIVEATSTPAERLRRLKMADEFLMEALVPFEIAYRGYMALCGHIR